MWDKKTMPIDFKLSDKEEQNDNDSVEMQDITNEDINGDKDTGKGEFKKTVIDTENDVENTTENDAGITTENNVENTTGNDAGITTGNHKEQEINIDIDLEFDLDALTDTKNDTFYHIDNNTEKNKIKENNDFLIHNENEINLTKDNTDALLNTDSCTDKSTNVFLSKLNTENEGLNTILYKTEKHPETTHNITPVSTNPSTYTSTHTSQVPISNNYIVIGTIPDIPNMEIPFRLVSQDTKDTSTYIENANNHCMDMKDNIKRNTSISDVKMGSKKNGQTRNEQIRNEQIRNEHKDAITNETYNEKFDNNLYDVSSCYGKTYNEKNKNKRAVNKETEKCGIQGSDKNESTGKVNTNDVKIKPKSLSVMDKFDESATNRNSSDYSDNIKVSSHKYETQDVKTQKSKNSYKDQKANKKHKPDLNNEEPDKSVSNQMNSKGSKNSETSSIKSQNASGNINTNINNKTNNTAQHWLSNSYRHRKDDLLNLTINKDTKNSPIDTNNSLFATNPDHPDKFKKQSLLTDAQPKIDLSEPKTSFNNDNKQRDESEHLHSIYNNDENDNGMGNGGKNGKIKKHINEYDNGNDNGNDISIDIGCDNGYNRHEGLYDSTRDNELNLHNSIYGNKYNSISKNICDVEYDSSLNHIGCEKNKLYGKPQEMYGMSKEEYSELNNSMYQQINDNESEMNGEFNLQTELKPLSYINPYKDKELSDFNNIYNNGYYQKNQDYSVIDNSSSHYEPLNNNYDSNCENNCENNNFDNTYDNTCESVCENIYENVCDNVRNKICQNVCENESEQMDTYLSEKAMRTNLYQEDYYVEHNGRDPYLNYHKSFTNQCDYMEDGYYNVKNGNNEIENSKLGNNIYNSYESLNNQNENSKLGNNIYNSYESLNNQIENSNNYRTEENIKYQKSYEDKYYEKQFVNSKTNQNTYERHKDKQFENYNDKSSKKCNDMNYKNHSDKQYKDENFQNQYEGVIYQKPYYKFNNYCTDNSPRSKSSHHNNNVSQVLETMQTAKHLDGTYAILRDHQFIDNGLRTSQPTKKKKLKKEPFEADVKRIYVKGTRKRPERLSFDDKVLNQKDYTFDYLNYDTKKVRFVNEYDKYNNENKKNLSEERPFHSTPGFEPNSLQMASEDTTHFTPSTISYGYPPVLDGRQNLTYSSECDNSSSPTESIFNCDPCMKKFKRLSTLKIHIFSHIKDAKIFNCPKATCDSGFKSQAIAIKHIQHYHREERTMLTEMLKRSKYTTMFRSYTALIDYHRLMNLHNPFINSFCFGCFSYPRSMEEHPCTRMFYNLQQCPSCKMDIVCGKLDVHVYNEQCRRPRIVIKDFDAR